MGLALGVTGDIGSGKSTVLGILRELGAETLSADDLARDALSPETPGALAVAEKFGGGVFKSDGSIDRKALASLVFSDKQARSDLERIIHPRVLEIVERRIREYRNENTAAPVLAVELPLLFESGAEGMFDRVLAVISEQETQLSRLTVDRGMSRAEALSRLAAQLPSSVKASRSDYVLENNSTVQALAESVKMLWVDIACPPAC